MRYLGILISFALIGAALGAAIVGIAGFRGGLSRKPPIEVFSDMDRQAKLRPQKPDDFFANGISSQLPPPGTIARSEPIQTVDGAVYAFEDSPVNTGKISGTTNFVETNPLLVNGAIARARPRAFRHLLRAVPWQTRRRQRHHQKNRRHARRGESARQADRRNGRRRNFQHNHPRQKHDGRLRPDCSRARPLGDYRLFARAAIKLAWLDERFVRATTSRAEIMNEFATQNRIAAAAGFVRLAKSRLPF